MMTPTLSICVPSRNRQVYFQHTIKALVASHRTDVEFIFTDNSDDPSVMNEFIEPYLADPRVKYIPTGEHVRPMMENWEVSAARTTGRWITFIGDDDYMDPEAAGLFARIEAADPNVDAIDWSKLNYFWPDEERRAVSQPVLLQTEVHRVPKSVLRERAFKWQSARQVVVSGFSIYHGAVSRRLFDKIRSLYGRQFEHPIVDYDSVMKIIMNGENFVFCRRPLSVLGVCPLSQSAALGNRDKADKTQADFHKEHTISMDDWDCYADFPFRSRHGVTACIGMVHHWFSRTYGHNFSGFEANFAEACAHQCNQSHDEHQFALFESAYREAFTYWKGGRYLKHFKPEFRRAAPQEPFTGYLEPNLYLMERSRWTRTAGDFYRLAADIMVPLPTLEINLELKVDERPLNAIRAERRAAGLR
jgi:glycosyltransferase involved in cell wall biosynthesis